MHRDLFSLENSVAKHKKEPSIEQEPGELKRTDNQASATRDIQETVEDQESAGSLELSQEIEILERIKSSRSKQDKEGMR